MKEEFSLNSLLPSNSKERKRRGRGIGSGLGKTCGYGHKGGKARAGRGKARYFEGGQLPIYRRLPKRGFNPLNNGIEAVCVNIGVIQQLINSGKLKKSETIDLQILQKIGIAKSRNNSLRILGNGKLDSSVNISADYFTASAQSSIEQAGGKAIKV